MSRQRCDQCHVGKPALPSRRRPGERVCRPCYRAQLVEDLERVRRYYQRREEERR